MKIILPVTDDLHAMDITGAEGRLRAWEFKSKHLHCGLLTYLAEPNETVANIELVVRSSVRNMYKPNWNKGFWFGAVVQLETTPMFELQDFDSVVDAFRNSKGNWQWVIAVDQLQKTAYARHMWVKAGVHNHFKRTVAQLSLNGYSVTSTYADRPRFFDGIESILRALAKPMKVLSFIMVWGTVALIAIEFMRLVR